MNNKEKRRNRRLLVVAGGTGGHVFPGIAVAKQLASQGWEIRWLGTADRMEAELVPSHGFVIDFIDVKGLVGSGISRKLKAPYMILKSILQARAHIRAFKPDVVLGMGGYVCGPAGLAAYCQNIPLVLHEQNAVAGLTNKLLSKIASCVLQAFPSAFVGKEVVGNPVRKELGQLTHTNYQTSEPLKILVMGGSQGARILNETLPITCKLLKRDVVVRHQAGKGHSGATRLCYHHANIKDVLVTEFIEDVAGAYQWADLIVCRSGALTVSEVAAAGLPAIFIPFMHQDRQQALNGEFLTKNNAALMIEQQELTPEKLAIMIDSLDAAKLKNLSEAAAALAILDADMRVANCINNLANLRETK